jgi:large subunit ribosomal protein L15
LQILADKTKSGVVDLSVLMENGLASRNDLIKILGRGELKAKLDVKVHAFSGTAKAAIENAGGTAVTL